MSPLFYWSFPNGTNQCGFRLSGLCVCFSCGGFRFMRVHIGYKASLLILFFLSTFASAATYTKTISMPPTSTVMSGGVPNMAANILEVGMSGVEYIPSAASESRAIANVSKGLAIPTSGIISSLKTGLRANAGSLAVGAVISGLVAGVDWIMTDGVLTKKSVGGPVPYDGQPGTFYWETGTDNKKYGSASDACDGFQAQFGRNEGATGNKLSSGSPTYMVCTLTNAQGQGLRETGVSRSGSGCPANTSYSPANGACLAAGGTSPVLESDLDVLDGFVQGKDGTWMRGLADEVCKGSLNYDACIGDMGAKPYVSGPPSASSPETTTTTTTSSPDGSTTEVSTKSRTDYGLSYPSSSPGSIAIDPKTTTTTTTTTRDPTGTITGTNTTTGTTTTSQPGSGTQIADGTFTDTPFPEVGPFYKQQFPGGFKDVWAKNKAAFDSSPFVSFLNSFVPSFSGSCPTWSLSFDIMAYAHFGSRQFGSLCYIFDIIKVIMLVTAMFTCRSIIFGG